MKIYKYLLQIVFIMHFFLYCINKEKQQKEFLKPYEGAYRFLLGSVEEIKDSSYLKSFGIEKLYINYDYYCGYINSNEKKFQMRLLGSKEMKEFPINNLQEKSFEFIVGSVKFNVLKLETRENGIVMKYKENSQGASAYKTKIPPYDLDACIKELKESIANDIKQNIWYPNNEPFSSEEEKDAYIEKLWKDDF